MDSNLPNQLTPMSKQIAESVEYEFEFQFEDTGDIWLRTDVTCMQAFECIKTGLLKNRPVSKVKLFAITEGTKSVSFVYDISNSKKGVNPWFLQVIQ